MELILHLKQVSTVIAILKGAKSGKTIALRGDIDALLIKEEADIEFKSTNPGVMHACGHDAHAAMLLGAVKILSEMMLSWMLHQMHKEVSYEERTRLWEDVKQ